jgi:hypothetical protein
LNDFPMCRNNNKKKTKKAKKNKPPPSRKSDNNSGDEGEKAKKRRHKKRKPISSSSSSSSSDSSSDSSGTESPPSSPPKKKRKHGKRLNKKRKQSKAADNQSGTANDSDTTDTLGDVDEEERERVETQFEMFNEIYPLEDRTPALQKKSVVGRYSLDVLMKYQARLDEKEKKENLGEEVFAKDARYPKTKYKKMSDDGKKKLHTARWNRLPLVPPQKYYGKTPKKRNAVIRNFPMEHYGITGQIPEATVGHLHNRSVKVALDSFCKATYKQARAGEKAGKYADLFQLMEGIVNYSILLQAIWPYDYTGLVMLKVLCEARWGETANLTGR